MKSLFKTNVMHSRSVEILPDNNYLVFGIPRVSMTKRSPEAVKQLHESMEEIDLLRKLRLAEAEETEEEITKLFEFATSEVSKIDSQATDRHLNETGHVQLESNTLNDEKPKSTQQLTQEKITNNVVNGIHSNNVKTDTNRTKSERDIPMVSKSRQFWEKLANSKSEIVELDHDKKAIKENHDNAVISSEILQKQQQLLKKTIPKRTSKDLWRTLRERKTEILQMRELISEKNAHAQESQKHHYHQQQSKKHENKTSHLWGFIFHKKKELLQMKRGHKVSHEGPKSLLDRGKKEDAKIDSKNSPTNFEDDFQKELAEKLRKRRSEISSNSVVVELKS
jgi:hypothetical protein